MTLAVPAALRPRRLLIVDDDHERAERDASELREAGFHVQTESTPERVFNHIRNARPHATLVSWDHQCFPAEELCGSLVEIGKTPVVVVAPEPNEQLELDAFNLHVDDVVSRPLRFRALGARLTAIASRRGPQDELCEVQLSGGLLELCTQTRRCTINGVDVRLSDPELLLLIALAERAGEVVSRQALHTGVRGLRHNPADRYIDAAVSRVRKKLGQASGLEDIIQTVRGEGYVLRVRSANRESQLRPIRRLG